jgi:sterol desaturase/sphingolipid hydroxylase (fatty acid hydroxylase superfamily)
MNIDRYRAIFRKKVIPPYYQGKMHLFIFTALELLSLFICGLFINWNWWTPFVIFISLFQASILTYFIHRFLLHQKFYGFHWAFKMHHWHHTFYVPGKMTYDDLNDIYMLLMPPWLQLVYFILYLPLATLILINLTQVKMIIVLPYIFGLIMWYGIYELIHWTEHLPIDHSFMRFKFVNWLRRHHIVHHSELKDKANFGIVEPSMDYLFGTKR